MDSAEKWRGSSRRSGPKAAEEAVSGAPGLRRREDEAGAAVAAAELEAEEGTKS